MLLAKDLLDWSPVRSSNTLHFGPPGEMAGQESRLQKGRKRKGGWVGFAFGNQRALYFHVSVQYYTVYSQYLVMTKRTIRSRKHFTVVLYNV